MEQGASRGNADSEKTYGNQAQGGTRGRPPLEAPPGRDRSPRNERRGNEGQRRDADVEQSSLDPGRHQRSHQLQAHSRRRDLGRGVDDTVRLPNERKRRKEERRGEGEPESGAGSAKDQATESSPRSGDLKQPHRSVNRCAEQMSEDIRIVTGKELQGRCHGQAGHRAQPASGGDVFDEEQKKRQPDQGWKDKRDLQADSGDWG